MSAALAPLPHHGTFFCLLRLLVVLPITPPLAGAQLPSPPPGQDPSPLFNPSVGMVAVLVAALAFFFAVYAVHILHWSSMAAAAAEETARARRAAARGLDPSIIDTFPTLVYSAVKGLRLGKGALECAVCLSEFEDHETLRLIPKCDHVFHPACIDEWLEFHSTCPVCRTELAPQPGESNHPVILSVESVHDRDESNIEVMLEENRGGDVDVERGRDEQEPADANDIPGQSRTHEEGSFRPRRFSRSHSTGHSLVGPGKDTERFTLRLPTEVRKQVMDRAVEMAGSSRRGNRASTGEGSSRGRYNLRRPQFLDRAFKSERWVFTRVPSFFTRSSPAVSPRVPGNRVEGGSVGQWTK